MDARTVWKKWLPNIPRFFRNPSWVEGKVTKIDSGTRLMTFPNIMWTRLELQKKSMQLFIDFFLIRNVLRMSLFKRFFFYNSFKLNECWFSIEWFACEVLDNQYCVVLFFIISSQGKMTQLKYKNKILYDQVQGFHLYFDTYKKKLIMYMKMR